MNMGQGFVPYVHTDGKTWEHYFVDPASRHPEKRLGGFIYFIKSHEGHKIKFTTRIREPNGIQAKKEANRKFKEIISKGKRFARYTIGEELHLFAKVREAEGGGEETKKIYRRNIKYLRQFWGEKFPNEINRQTLADFYNWWALTHRDPKTGRPHTMENVLKVFRNFCRFLTEKQHNGIPLLPAIPKMEDPNKIDIIAERKKKKERILTKAEFRSILDSALTEREYFTSLIMYTMATRVEETLDLDFLRNILLDEPVPVYRWYVDSNKAKRMGQHALPTFLIEPLRALREFRRRQGTHLLFPQANNAQKPMWAAQIDWDGWRKRAGLDWHWTSHTFRHTCLTNLIGSGVPHATIMKLYRVSLQVLTQTYHHVTDQDRISYRDIIEVPR